MKEGVKQAVPKRLVNWWITWEDLNWPEGVWNPFLFHGLWLYRANGGYYLGS